MSEPHRFTTVRIGVLRLDVSGHSIESDIRILRSADGGYRLLAGTLSDPVPTIEDAEKRATSEPCPPDARFEVRWREDGASLAPGERPCPVCGAPVFASPRYPRKLCPACVIEAVDADGRSLHFANTDLSGGFEARHTDDGSPHLGGQCFVRRIRCLAEEGKFGGIVVQPVTE